MLKAMAEQLIEGDGWISSDCLYTGLREQSVEIHEPYRYELR